MHKKIFHSSFLTVFLVLVATVALIMGILFRFFEKQLQAELENEAEFLSQAVEKDGSGFFDGFDSPGNRVTLIGADGTVLYDSRADAKTLDNHAGRREIKEAMATGTGMSTRYSPTLTEKTVYYAVKLSNGSILRISTEQYTIVSILFGLTQPFLLYRKLLRNPL